MIDFLDQLDNNVSNDDIERAIRKSLVDEVSRHPTLADEKMSTLYRWIAALMKYLPLRTVVYDFLEELRQELNQVQKSIARSGYPFALIVKSIFTTFFIINFLSNGFTRKCEHKTIRKWTEKSMLKF